MDAAAAKLAQAKDRPQVAVKARLRYIRRFNNLKNERSSWNAHWQDLNRFILPRAARFNASDRNKGVKKHNNIINGRATKALRVLAAGMMSGITSPARPWYKLSTQDPDLAENPAVRTWLELVEQRHRDVLAKSNVYNDLATMYAGLGTYGTAVTILEEDPEIVVRSFTVPVGQFYLATGANGEVNALYRELSMTVGQMVEMFGLEKCSSFAQAQYKAGNVDTWVWVIHVIEPNTDRVEGREDASGMKWRSAWFEYGASGTTAPQDDATGGYQGEPIGFLRESGYREFPVLAPRWDVTGEDVYGGAPAMDCLGDVKGLQLLEKRKALAVDKLVDPPMAGPTTLRAGRASLLPGDVTYIDSTPGSQKYEPAMTIDPAGVRAVTEAIKEHEGRIDATFLADLWLQMTDLDRGNITAREVDERHEEKMLQLGPVLERLHRELLTPLIQRVFHIMERLGLLPPAPPELHGQEIKIEFVSIMAQAQKALGLVGLNTLAGFVTQLAPIRPDAPDSLNVDKMIEEVASIVGVKSGLLLNVDELAQLRAKRAQAQQQQQMAAQAAQSAKAVKDLSGADTAGKNGLTDVLGALGGPASGLLQQRGAA